MRRNRLLERPAIAAPIERLSFFVSFVVSSYSHSIVAGGLLLMSYTTRLTPGTQLMIRVEIRASKS
jgi:hypothetical protein